MLLLYPREILILDLEVNQTVGVIAIERTGVPFLQVCVIYMLYPQKLIMNVVERENIILEMSLVPLSLFYLFKN